MKKKIAYAAGLLALFMTTNAFALDLNVKYDVDNCELNLTGTAYAPVSVIVSASDSAELASDSLTSTIAAAQYSWRGETSINEVIPIDPNLPSGTYTLRARTNEQYLAANSSADRLYGSVVDNEQIAEKSFYHINTTDAALLLSEINKVANNASALYSLISQGAVGSYSTPCIELLELDASEFGICGSYVCRQMVGTKKGAAYSKLEDVKQLITEYSLLYDISNASSSASAISSIEANASVFGEANVDTYVSGMDSGAQQKFFELIKAFSANGRTFSQEIPELSALATIQSADRWQVLKTVITDTHKTVLNIDYNVNNPDKVFQTMMTYTYTDFEDIATGFSNAVKAVKNGGQSSGNSSSGGGGGGFGSFQVAPSAPEQRGENKASTGFSDVSSDFWANNAIMRLSELGVVSGYPNGTFAPNGYVTRAEFVKMLCTAFAIQSVDSNIAFDDVSTYDWYYEYIRIAHGNGIINGISSSQFNPNGTITREDAATIVYRYLNTKGMLSGATMNFVDSSGFSAYAKDPIAALAGNGVINGVGEGIFDAKGNITRAACAVLICNCLDL